MNKPQALRDWLTAANPQIRTNPDTLQMFVEKGAVAARAPSDPSLPIGGYEYRYKVQLLVTDYAGPLDGLIAPVLTWLADQQPELIESYASNNAAITFDVDLLDEGKADILLELELTELVLLTERPDRSGYDITRPREPFAPVGADRAWTLWLQDVQVAAWTERE